MARNDQCNNCFEDFDLTQRAQDCPICLRFGTNCLGNNHPRGDSERQFHEDPAVEGLTRRLKDMETTIDRIIDSKVESKVLAMKLGEKAKGVTTVAQFTEELRKKNELFPSPQLTADLEGLEIVARLAAEVPQFPSDGDGEKDTCQPFVTSQIELLQRGVLHHRHKTQENSFNEAKAADFKQRIEDSHEIFSFSNRKPDIVCYPKGFDGAAAISMLGEVKGCGYLHNDFPDAAIGQILDFSKSLLENHQMHRGMLFSFLTDGNRFQFFRCTRVAGAYQFEMSSVLLGMRGWQVLFGLLSLESAALGLEIISVPNLAVKEGLGRGRFVVAYRAERVVDKVQLVLKVYDRADELHFLREQDILKRLTASEHVPKFELEDRGGKYLITVVSPVGYNSMLLPPDKSFTPAMAITLINVLQTVHELGYIHRDVKPDNIYFREGDLEHIILSDWSSSAERDVRCPFEGTILFASQPDPDGHHFPTRQVDLYSLVKSVFCLVRQQQPALNDWQTVEDYWCKVEDNFPSFRRALALAKEANYDGLKAHMNSVW